MSVCREKVPVNNNCCQFDTCRDLSPLHSNVHNYLSDAVVSVKTLTILTTASNTSTVPLTITLTPPAAFNNNLRGDVWLEGNGYFIKGHYIVCPAHMVLIPPTTTSAVNRYPFTTKGAGNFELGPDIPNYNQMTKVSRIFVEVKNVNGCPYNFIYEAESGNA